jgi:hypothetical protein
MKTKHTPALDLNVTMVTNTLQPIRLSQYFRDIFVFEKYTELISFSKKKIIH